MGHGGLGTSRGHPLLERDDELERLRSLLAEARDEVGSLVVVEGPPGIGKTTLLRALAAEAEGEGFVVLSARGHELETSFPFGVVRQLFEPCVAGLSPGDRELALAGAASLAAPLVDPTRDPGEALESPDPFARLHGLYWLTANLAERRPLVLLVDDVHWSDRPSLRWLHYLAPRLDGVRGLVVAAARSTAPDAPVEELEELKHRGGATAVCPGALSPAGSARLLAGHVEAELASRVLEDAYEATGGNPFLLTELGRELASARSLSDHPFLLPELDRQPEGGGSSSEPELLSWLGDLTSMTVTRSVQQQLARLSDAARGVAEAVAVLGDGAQLRHVTTLTGHSERVVLDAVDELDASGIFDASRSLEFTHPLIREAVHRGLPPGRRADDHRTAARLLMDEPGRVQSVAQHLLAVPPAADPWVVEVLQAAAGAATSAGSPEIAATYLQRALDEPPAGGRRAETLLGLGRAERSSGSTRQAVVHLEEAARSSDDPLLQRAALAPRVAIGTELGDAAGAFRLARQALALLPPGTGDAAEAELVFMGCMHGLAVPETADDAAALLEVPRTGPKGELTTAEVARILLAAQTAALRGERSRAVEQLEQIAGILAELDDPGSLTAIGFVQTFLSVDDIARATLEQAVKANRRAGETPFLANALQGSLHLHLRAGNLAAGIADAELLISLGARMQSPNFVDYGNTLLALHLVEEGHHDQAAALVVEAGRPGQDPVGPWNALWWSYARSVVALAQGAWPEARTRALELGASLEAINVTSPDYIPWRSVAARALANEGDPAAAVALAREELALSRRAEAHRAIGVSLVTLGVVEEDLDRGLDALTEAVEVLAGTPARLEHARALCELGSALRRANRRKEARRPLQEAIVLARACGATPLAERAHGELRATGARPRRLVFDGVDALTARERQIAELAAGGSSNPEIAQALFVTRKTVETHLGAVYRKLGIENRHQLADTLDAGR